LLFCSLKNFERNNRFINKKLKLFLYEEKFSEMEEEATDEMEVAKEKDE